MKVWGRGAYILSGGITLQIRLDGLVLLVEVSQVGDQILDDVGVRQRVDLDIRGRFGGDSAQACQGVLAVDVHGAASTDTLSATPSEGQRRILLVLDLDQGIQDHGTGLVEIDVVGLKPGLLGRGIRVPSVDGEGLDPGLLGLADRRHGAREDGAGSESCPGGAEDSRRGAESGHGGDGRGPRCVLENWICLDGDCFFCKLDPAEPAAEETLKGESEMLISSRRPIN